MIVRSSTVTVLVIAVVAALYALIALPGNLASKGAKREPSTERIDRHTGARILTADDHLRSARETGDAAAALGLLEELDPGLRQHARITRATRMLERELEAARWPGDRGTPPSEPTALCAWLIEALHDAPQAAEIESFFTGSGEGLDADAAALALQLRDSDRDAPAALIERARELAKRYDEAGRQRAAIRWWLRAFDAEPLADSTRSHLAAWLIAERRLTAAAMVLGPRRASDDPALDDLRASLARWRDRPEEEIELLESLLPTRADVERRLADHRRLAALHLRLGSPQGALPHSLAIARTTGSPDDLEATAALAFDAARPNLGFALLIERIESSEQPTRSRLRRELVERAELDMRYELALEHLQLLSDGDPFGADAEHLRELLRRLDMRDELAELLLLRIRSRPADPALNHRACALLVGLGRLADARRILTALTSNTDDPAVFFAELDRAASADVPDLDTLAAGWVASTRFDRERLLPELLATLGGLPGRFPQTLRELENHHLDAPGVAPQLIAACDLLPTAAERLRAIGSLAARNPGDPRLTQAWADRATWLGDAAEERTARRALLWLRPTDRDNLKALGLRLEADRRWLEAAAIEAARIVVEPDPGQPTLRTAQLLIAAGDRDGALDIVTSRLAVDELKVAERVALADLAFAERDFDLAARAYSRALGEDPDHPVALYHLGQIRSWTERPRDAIPLFERRLEAAPDHDAARVHYHLAEALTAVGDATAARPHYAAARAGLPAADAADSATRAMLARCAARLDDPRTAVTLLRGLLAERPAEVGHMLALAAALVATTNDPRDAEAQRLVDSALRLDPSGESTLRSAATHLRARGDVARAVELLERSLDRHGEDRFLRAELAGIGERTGTYRDALGHAERWLSLQPGSFHAAEAEQRLADRLAQHAVLDANWRTIGDDEIAEITLAGSDVLTDELRLNAGVGHASYSGRAPAIDGGATDVTTDTARLDLGIDWRLGAPRTVLGAGVEAFPGASGNATVGGWVGYHREWSGTYRSLEVRAFVNELWTDTGAAPGLGGRQDGLTAEYFQGLGERHHLGANLRYRRLGAELPAANGRDHDGRIDAQLTVGRRLWGDSAAVTEPFRMRRTPSIPNAPFLGLLDAADDQPGALTNERGRSQGLAWLAWQSIRQLGDESLVAALPIGDRFDYLLAGARADLIVADGLGAKLEAHVGYEFQDDQPNYSVEFAATWRPRRLIEGSVRLGYGSAVGRAGGSDDSSWFGTHWVLRW